MYQIGETVLYGTEGVCRIAEMQEMKVGGKKKQYYVLKPVYREGATVFVPADNEQLLERMKRVLSAEEIRQLLAEVCTEELDWIEDPGERKAEYQKILRSGDRCAVVRMIRVLYLRRQHLRSAGRQLRSGDDQLLREAEKLLNDEFALVLNIPQHQVPEYIRSQIEASA
ncbi:MAG: CarD family transcriptional regulator [Oscillospiraceae bacterium]|nr:CarD family transcriptional regulator [Oscillospiraceae bacterium]